MTDRGDSREVHEEPVEGQILEADPSFGDESAQSEDHRSQRRIKTLRQGNISYDRQRLLMNCLVMDLSEHGAKLRPDDAFRCPSFFLLKITREDPYICRVAWRANGHLGVEFMEDL